MVERINGLKKVSDEQYLVRVLSYGCEAAHIVGQSVKKGL